MKFSILVAVIAVFAPLFTFAQKEKDAIIKSLDARSSEFTNVARQLWENPELGYLEEKSAALLQGELQKAGFQIASGVAGMPTAYWRKEERNFWKEEELTSNTRRCWEIENQHLIIESK